MIHPIYNGESMELSVILKVDGVKLTQGQLDNADNLVFVAKKDITLADGAAGTIKKERGSGIVVLAWTQDDEPNLTITIDRADTKTLEPGTFHLGFAYIKTATVGGLADMKSSQGYFASVEIKDSVVGELKA